MRKFPFSLSPLTVIYFQLWIFWDVSHQFGGNMQSLCSLSCKVLSQPSLWNALPMWKLQKCISGPTFSLLHGVLCVCVCVYVCVRACAHVHCVFKIENWHLSFSKSCPNFPSFFKKCFASSTSTAVYLFIEFPVHAVHLTNKGTLDALQVIKKLKVKQLKLRRVT